VTKATQKPALPQLGKRHWVEDCCRQTLSSQEAVPDYCGKAWYIHAHVRASAGKHVQIWPGEDEWSTYARRVGEHFQLNYSI
jgi:hypothetical protein